MRTCELNANEIFDVYLGTDGSHDKMNVKFVISDSENIRRRIFLQIKIFEKRCTRIQVVPS